MDSVIPLHERRPAAGRRPPLAAQAEAAQWKVLLALHERLLGCDELQLLLDRFLAWALEAGLAQGLGVHLDGEPAERQLGDTAPHRSTYRLELNGTFLGEVTAMRRRRYRESELALLEAGLAALAKGLRLTGERRRLEDLATRDGLTGLLNRNALDESLGREFARARRQGSALSLLVIDVDDFKTLNDSAGHLAGDRALCEIASALLASTRETDLVFRQGGDEFAVLMPNMDIDAAGAVGERIRNNLARRSQFSVPGGRGDLLSLPGVSIGAAEHLAGEAPEAFLQRADRCLYRAKADGRGRLAVDR